MGPPRARLDQNGCGLLAMCGWSLCSGLLRSLPFYPVFVQTRPLGHSSGHHREVSRAKNNCWPLAVFHAYFAKWPTISQVVGRYGQPYTCTDDIPYSPEHFADMMIASLCGFPHTAAYLVVSLDGHRHKQFILATQTAKKWLATWPVLKKKVLGVRTEREQFETPCSVVN